MLKGYMIKIYGLLECFCINC